MYKRIFVPIDGSSTSEHALQEAVRLAKDQQAELYLAHVLEDAPLWNAEGYLDAVSLEAALKESGEKILADGLAQAQAAGVTAHGSLLPAHGQRTGRVIVEEAQRRNADLLVMGTHGRRGFDHLLFGSVAEGVVRAATQPILLIRAK